MSSSRDRKREFLPWILAVAWEWFREYFPWSLLPLPTGATVIILIINNPVPVVPTSLTPPGNQPVPPGAFPPERPGEEIAWDTTTSTIEDDSGNELTVSIGVLHGDMRWLLGSTTHVGIHDGDSIRFEQVISSLAPTAELPVILVGMASHENAVDDPAEENRRAQIRSDAMANYAATHFTRHPEIRKLNLGAYEGADSSSVNSATERYVVVLEIRCLDENTDIISGIRNALLDSHERGKLPFDPMAYTNFTSERFAVPLSRSGNPTLRVPMCSSGETATT
jgi:hypothetical protein